MAAYAEDLADIPAKELDAACCYARRNSQFMPVSATIRDAAKKLRAKHSGDFLGVPAIEYPDPEPMTPEEQKRYNIAMAELKLKLGTSQEQPKKKLFTIRPSTRSLAEQKAELKRKGYL